MLGDFCVDKSCGHESTEGSREQRGVGRKAEGARKSSMQGRRRGQRTAKARKIPERARAARGGGWEHGKLLPWPTALPFWVSPVLGRFWRWCQSHWPRGRAAGGCTPPPWCSPRPRCRWVSCSWWTAGAPPEPGTCRAEKLVPIQQPEAN